MKPSSSQSPYSGTGAGGKFRKPPISRKRPSTPYDRPSLTTTTTNNKPEEEPQTGDGWISKLFVNPAKRLIVGGATRMLPIFFTRLEEDEEDEVKESESESDLDNQDIDATGNAYGDAKHTLELKSSGDAGPSNQMDKLKGSSEQNNVQQDNSIADLGLDEIENMLKGKQFSRDESNRLMEILNSRLADVSNAEGEKKTSTVSQWQANADVLDRETPSAFAMGKRYDAEKAVLETPIPRLQSNIQDEIAASPIDIAKAYMGSRTSDLGFNTYNITSTDNREQHNDMVPSKPHFLTPSSKSSTCWPGAVVQNQRGYLTPQTQRGRYGLHNIPRTPYSRTIYSRPKPKLNQIQADSRPSNYSVTPFQQSRTPAPWQVKTSSNVMDGGYGSVGPIRRVRNKLASEPPSEGPKSLASAQIGSTSSASRSFVPVFQKNPGTAGTSGTSNLHTADKHGQSSKGEVNAAGPSNETVRKILEQLDRHKPTPKEKTAELRRATEWKRSPSEDTTLMPKASTLTLRGPDLQISGVVSGDRSFIKETDGGVRFKDPIKTDAAIRASSSVDAGTGPSFDLRNTSAADEKSSFTNIKGKEEKTQPLDNQINSQDVTRKRPSQSILKPISSKRPDPQQIMSSDNGLGFTFPFSQNTNSASEPPTPSIMPSFSATGVPQSKELPAIPTYSFGTKKSGERVVFSFPSTSNNTPINDGDSDLKFKFGSDKKRVSFASVGSDAIIIN